MWQSKYISLYGLKEHLVRLSDKKKAIDVVRPLPYIVLKQLRESINIEWAYNSNGIEGNSLTLRETQIVLQEGMTIHGKSLREHFETFNHQKALDFLYEIVDQSELISTKDILDIHQFILGNISDDWAGRIRNAGVRISGSNFMPPNAQKVPDLLNELIEYINSNPEELHPVALATIFHHRFVWIHPFFDGNGRTVRLIMNLLLLRSGFPPAIILKNDRKKYYNALNQANNGNLEKLGLLMAQASERSLNIYLNSIPGQEEEISYSSEYISLLARKGRIDAHKEGRSWYTTKSAIEEYVRTKKK